MEKKNYNIEQEVKKTMESIDQIQRVDGNPFLYTRLQERLKQQNEAKSETRHSLFPAWQLALIIGLFVVNCFAFMQSDFFESKTAEVTIEDFANEYALTKSEEDLYYISVND